MEGQRYLARVLKVIDGDTIKVLVEDREIVVRILLIDTPELKHPKKPKEKYSEEASQFAMEKLKVDSEILLEFEHSVLDIYNRFLAHVFYKENDILKLYQEQILLEGLAIVSFTRYYSESKYIDRLIEAENKAKELKKNIWSE